MIRNSGAFSLLGMSKSRACTFGAVLLIWLSCSSLLVAAQDGITDPVEGVLIPTIVSSRTKPSKSSSTMMGSSSITSLHQEMKPRS
uniref:Uncharacterized protein n=1 Tax=Populus trichocarpa TaxID=3694 RepID=A0A2K1Y6C7_POPTR